MRVYIGADHRGFELKQEIKKWLEEEGYEVVDVGAYQIDPEDDYPDFAIKAAKGVASDPDSRGVLVCGSGHGVDIVANRFHEVRSIIGFNEKVVVQGREHEKANVLSLASDWISKDEGLKLVKVFLTTEFSGDDRHKRRLQKIESVRE